MYAVTHFLVGSMLGQAVGNPYAACALGLASHAVLDAIPHADYSKIVHGAIDLAAAATVAFVSLRAGAGAVFGGLSAILPDLEVAVLHLRMAKYPTECKRKLLFPSHRGLIRHGRLRLPWGVVTQICTVVAVWIVIRGVLM